MTQMVDCRAVQRPSSVGHVLQELQVLAVQMVDCRRLGQPFLVDHVLQELQAV